MREPNIVAVAVKPDAEKFGAFGLDDKGKWHRLSPSWVRDVCEDQLKTFTVPTAEQGRMAKVTRLTPVKIGTKLVVGESLVSATQRAVLALKLLARGEPVVVPREKVA